jgi:DNA-binding response OmpR family regulator
MQQQTILLITSRPGQLQDLAGEIGDDPAARLLTVTTLRDAEAAAKSASPVLAIVDERVGDATGLDVVRHLIGIDAFIHTAVLSDADEEEFHRLSEGLGILSRLPLQPERKEVRRLLETLRRLLPPSLEKVN